MRSLAIVCACASWATAAPPADRVAKVRADLDAHRTCNDSCCLAAPWFGDGAIDAADVAAARRAVADRDPRVAALAMHVLATTGELADVPALERAIDDTRAAGEVPAVEISQAMKRCYAVQWTATTVAAEALRALSHVFATSFPTAADYRWYRKQHADPEASFDYWYAQLRMQRPPDAALLARLRKREPVLVARALAAYCEEDCGDGGALEDALRRVGAERVMSWLVSSEQFPEWDNPDIFAEAVHNVLRRGERVFGDAQVPRLEALIDNHAFPPYLLARVAVVASRIRPGEAIRIWTHALHALPKDRGLVLAEAAAREPIAFADTLVASFTGDDVVPILEGLARAGKAGASTFMRALAHHSLSADDEAGVIALAKAGRAIGCTGITDPALLHARAGKGMTAAQLDGEQQRTRELRARVIREVSACTKP